LELRDNSALTPALSQGKRAAAGRVKGGPSDEDM
jgi:hypothetical protein